MEAVEGALGATIRAWSPVSGGDVASSYRVELVEGGPVFAKSHRRPPPGFFLTEAAGLRWLAEAEAVAVPEVLAAADGGGPTDRGPVAFLVLRWVDEGRPGPGTDGQLGRALAAMHRAGAPSFGRQDARPTGSRSLPNDPCDTWSAFYGQRRLLPLARMAHDAEALGPSTCRDLERLAERLDQVGGPPEAPSRLHGDLWAGNRLVDVDGRNWLIDPAAHGGHREFDLAMMRLFGGFGTSCFRAYDEAFPLAAGWEERVSLHQVAPLVVHAVKFGGGYRGAAAAAIGRYV